MDNLYKDEKFTKLVADLKNLPKINAPENFEYNLMTKIQNQNFNRGSSTKEQQFNWIKFFAPSAAIVTVILLFFIFYPQKEEIQNQIINQAKTTDSQSIVSNSNLAINENDASKAKETKIPVKSPSLSSSKNLTAQPSNQNPRALINNPRSVAIDDYISGSKVNRSVIDKGAIVNEGAPPIGDGFLIEKKTDKATLEKMRAAVDSIKRAQEKADSLKKIKK